MMKVNMTDINVILISDKVVRRVSGLQLPKVKTDQENANAVGPYGISNWTHLFQLQGCSFLKFTVFLHSFKMSTLEKLEKVLFPQKIN